MRNRMTNLLIFFLVSIVIAGGCKRAPYYFSSQAFDEIIARIDRGDQSGAEQMIFEEIKRAQGNTPVVFDDLLKIIEQLQAGEIADAGAAIRNYDIHYKNMPAEIQAKMYAPRDFSIKLNKILQPHNIRAKVKWVQEAGKESIDCGELKIGRLMVALAMGQSNAANHGQTQYESKQAVFNFYDGKCTRARDPLQGASGAGGSVWTRLGDRLIQQGLYDIVLLVPVAEGGSKIARWAPGGDLNPRIGAAIDALEQQGLRPTHIFWHQGESDGVHFTPGREYRRSFLAMLEDIRERGVDAPIYVAVATICGRGSISHEIRRVQKELADASRDILPGPDTDQINGDGDRYDNCHFTQQGLDKHADLWLEAIMNSKSVQGNN